jgi:hypothetical protein
MPPAVTSDGGEYWPVKLLINDQEQQHKLMK